MERIVLPNVLVIVASLSLWTMAFQSTVDASSDRHAEHLVSTVRALTFHEEEARNVMKGEPLLEEGTPIMAAASGHWF